MKSKIIAAIIVLFVINITLIVGIGYVVYHFISKFW